MSKSNKGTATTIEDSSTMVDKSQTQEGISHALSNVSSHSTMIMISALENFTAKVAVQLMDKSALGSMARI